MMENPFIIDHEKYRDLAQSNRSSYQQARSFPHTYFDDFLPPDICDQLLREFPDPKSDAWIRFNDPTGLKLASQGVMSLGETAGLVLGFFNSAAFIEFLEILTGIEGLIPDPWFEGGGLHQIPRDGFLKIHADFNRHERLRLDRRINVLLYLNKDWKEEYGGHLELWNREMTECEERILPAFNRCAIFNTTDFSYHGHPHPLTCPESMSRKSLAFYYYTNGRPDVEVTQSHSTMYQPTPEEHARMQRAGYRFRDACSRSLDAFASLAHKPSALLRRLASRIKPRY